MNSAKTQTAAQCEAIEPGEPLELQPKGGRAGAGKGTRRRNETNEIMKERLGEVKRSEVKPQQRRSLREERAQKGETQNEFGKKRGNFSHGNTQRRYETRRDQSERSKRSSSSCMMIITMIAHARRVFSSLLHPPPLPLPLHLILLCFLPLRQRQRQLQSPHGSHTEDRGQFSLSCSRSFIRVFGDRSIVLYRIFYSIFNIILSIP